MDPGEGRTLDAETRHRKGTSPHSSTLAVNRDNFESKSLSSTSSEASSRPLLNVNASLRDRPGTAVTSDSQNFAKSVRPNNDEESPLSPPMAWSREGTDEELSKYQELQMRQRNDSQHSPQTQGLANILTDSFAPPTVIKSEVDLVAKRASMDMQSTTIASSENSTGSQADVANEKRARPRSSQSSSSMTTTRHSRSGRSKAITKASEEGRQHEPDLSISVASAVRIDRTVSPPSNPHCQRQRSSGSSGKKTRCICSSCQQERTATTPPQRSFRYGQFLGGSEAMPIYAGPLGLGDDIPSPTPSPPPPGRMSIHMAMRGRSPISSPSGSPLLTMSHSSLPVSTATKGKSVRRGLQDGSLRSASAQDVTDSSPSTSSHPVVTGFQSQALDPKVRSSKKSPRTTAHSPPEATPLSYSPSSPSSPTCPSSLTKSTFQAETEKDTSPSLSPFFLSKRSFSPPGQASSFSSALSTSPPMRADTLHTHNMLQQSTSVSDQLNSSSSLKLPSNSGSPVSNSDSPRLAPPVVLVQSPTVESLSGFSEASPRLIPHQTGDRNPLLYSSVLASSTASSTTPVSPNFSRSPRSPSQQPLSPGSQHGAAATPPLSPSRKKEGHHHSVLSGLEKKEFESWSFSGQIQDRVIRTSPTPQYKSALLSSGPKEKTHLHRQSQIQQPKIFSRHQPSNAQQQRQQHQSHSQSTSARSSQTNLASQESNPNKRLWQARGQSLSKDPVDGTLKKAAVDAKSSRKDAGEGDRGVPRNMSGDTSATASQSALKKSESSGSSLHVLRRSRSAPILASGQISYADILKASIKTNSTPLLPSAGYGRLSSPEPTIPSSHLISLPFPIVSSSTSGAVSPISGGISSPDGGSHKANLSISPTITRTMKSLKRPSLSSSKSDNNLKARIDKNNMSAPMRSLLSSLAPLNATTNLRFESMSRDLDKKQTFSEQGSSKNDTKGTGDMTGHSSGPVENRPTKKNVDDSEELGHTSDISEGAPSRDIANTPIDIADDPLRVSKTGLSFLHHHEVEAVTSPEADHRSQSILSSSLVVSDQYDSLKKVGPLSNPGTASNKTSSDVERKSETIVETSMDSTSKSPLLETKASHSVDKSDGESRWSETKETGETRVIERAQMDINSECPFQQQLALQAQEQEEQEQDENDLQLGSSSSGFKTRRKRINSIGGKKLLLKKKSSLHNLHGSFQQQQQQSQQQAQPQFDSNGSNADDSSAASTAKASAAPSDYVIPPFYFPMGKPVAATKRRQRVHSAATKAKEIFVVVENGSLSEDGFVAITVQCCELPRYMNRALFRKVDIAGSGEVRFPEFERVWESLVETCPDEISMIFMILKQPNANVLTPTDFEVLLQDLVLFHPGLEFLSGNAVFQERYLETVITRIFYESNRRHGKMSLADLRRSNFDKTLRKLENSDLNQTEDCFSYKHFYVIYCKFWELDQDHDLILDEQDLAGYSGGAISMRIIRRVMQGYGNETGMFVVPDQELLLQQQQQQQIMFMQHQQQLQQQQQLHHLQQQQVIREQALQDQYVSGSTLGTTTTANQDLGSVVPTSLLDAEAGMVTVDLSDGEEAVEQPNTLRRSNSGALSLSEMSPSDTTETATVVVADVSIVGAMSVSSPGVDAMLSTFSTSTTMMMNSTHNMAVPQRVTLSGPGGQCRPQNYRMTYKGFIWFLLAETDKQTTTSIEYWFRCMDLDGDGVLTVFELEQLFQEQATRMAILGMESFGFRDAICQMQDLVGPRETGLVRLSDLKQCGQAGPFIDLFCNVVRWRSFEAHQHQIRMRQQQIAMQRAADAAWEEVVTGEDLFDGDDDDEEDDDEEIDDDHLDDDLDDDDLDDDDLEDGDEEMDNLEDDGEEEGSGSGSGSGEFDDEDTLTKKSELKGAGRAESEGGPSCSVGVSEGSCKSPEAVVTARRLDIAMTEAKAIAGSRVGLGLGVTIIKGLDSKLELGELPYQSVGFRSDNYTSDSRGGQEAKDKIAVEMSNASVKALKRKRAKERRRRRRQAMMRRALLEEQRKEKALLATIRESPWIVYVESEYEKLVTIERPQSRTGWDQEEEEEDEEEEEMDDDDEEEVMDEEDMMIEEGRDPIAAAAAAAVAAQQLQQLQHQLQQHQLQQHQFQQHQQLQQRQLQHQIGFAQIEVDVAEGAFAVQMDHRTQQTKVSGGPAAVLVRGISSTMKSGFEFGQDFEQISMDPAGSSNISNSD